MSHAGTHTATSTISLPTEESSSIGSSVTTATKGNAKLGRLHGYSDRTTIYRRISRRFLSRTPEFASWCKPLPKTEVRHVVLLVLDAFQTIKGGNADDTDGGCFIHFLSLQDERGQMEDIENYIKSVVEKDERKYEAFFIKGGKFGSGGFKHSDIELSNINWMRSAPDFVTKFEQKLDNKPGIVPAARNPIDFVRLLVDSGCQCRRITHLNLYLIPNLGPHILGLAKNLANSRGAIPIRSRPSISLTLRLGNGRNAGKAISDVP